MISTQAPGSGRGHLHWSDIMENDDSIHRLVKALPAAQAMSAKQILLEGDTVAKTIELGRNAMDFTSDTTLNIIEGCGERPACQKGCSYCCHLNVQASIPEVVTVAAHILAAFDDGDREKLLERIDAHIKATDGLTYDQRFDFRTPCPLLVDDACSAYEARPLYCRSYHSFDVEDCRRDLDRPVDRGKITCNAPAFLVASLVGAGLRVALKGQRLDYRAMDFVRALRIALLNPSIIEGWSADPHAFDDAASDRAYPPSPGLREQLDKEFKATYREITNRPEWREIEPQHP
jgi:Fe-S-cluster containining protein